MTDDIVKYLRLSRTRFNRHAEAADEIERLLAQVERWKEIANNLLIAGEYQLDKLTGGASKKDLHPMWVIAWEEHDKAVRGD
jgi:hypothetical protein